MFRLFRRNNPSRQDQALGNLDAAAEQFRQAAEQLGAADACLFWDLAAAVDRLRRHIAENPAHLNPLRRLWVFFIPHSAEKALAWAAMASRDPLAEPDRSALGYFEAFLALLAEADQACLRRSYDALESSAAALESQLQQVRL